jgi:tyrosinase
VAAPKVQAAVAAAPTPTSHSSAAAGSTAPHVHANLAQAPAAHHNPAPGHAASSDPPQDADFSHVPVVGQHAHNSEEDKLWEWTARVHVKKYEVGGSFSVEFFLGDVPSDPAHWRTSPNFIGAHQVFANRCVESSSAVMFAC